MAALLGYLGADSVFLHICLFGRLFPVNIQIILQGKKKDQHQHTHTHTISSKLLCILPRAVRVPVHWWQASTTSRFIVCLRSKALCLKGVKKKKKEIEVEAWIDFFNQYGQVQFGSLKELTKNDDSKTPCSIKIALLRRKRGFSVTSVTLCSVGLPLLQLVLSIMPLILRHFIKIIRYTGAYSIFSAFQRLCKATHTFEICTWHFFLEKLSTSAHW